MDPHTNPTTENEGGQPTDLGPEIRFSTSGEDWKRDVNVVVVEESLQNTLQYLKEAEGEHDFVLRITEPVKKHVEKLRQETMEKLEQVRLDFAKTEDINIKFSQKFEKRRANLEEMKAKLEETKAKLEEMKAKQEETKAKLEEMNAKLEKMNAKLEKMNVNLNEEFKMSRKGMMEKMEQIKLEFHEKFNMLQKSIEAQEMPIVESIDRKKKKVETLTTTLELLENIAKRIGGEQKVVLKDTGSLFWLPRCGIPRYQMVVDQGIFDSLNIDEKDNVQSALKLKTFNLVIEDLDAAADETNQAESSSGEKAESGSGTRDDMQETGEEMPKD